MTAPTQDEIDRQALLAQMGGPLQVGSTTPTGMPPGASTATDPTYSASNPAPPQAGPTAPPPLSDPGAPDLSSYTRRNVGTGGAGAGAASGALAGVGIGSIGGPVLAALGGVAGGLTGAVKGAFTKHAASAATDFGVDDASKAIEQEYEHALGRKASPQEIQAQLQGQGLKTGDRWVGQQGLSSVLNSIAASDEAKKYSAAGSQQPADPSATTSASGPAAPDASGADPYAGLPPALAAVYKKYGVSDGGNGAGFTDFGYWKDKPSEWSRLDADLAGTGNDQPGPKDAGAALNSGKNAPPGWGGSPTAPPVAQGGDSPYMTGTAFPTDSAFFTQLMDRLNSMSGGIDRQALLSQMQG